MKTHHMTILALLCAQLSLAQTTTISGRVINATNDTCQLWKSLYSADFGGFAILPLDTVFLDEKREFSFSINIDSPTSAFLDLGNEATSILLDPGDELFLTVNALLFDETITYSGKGALKNNHIARLSAMRSRTDTIYSKEFASLDSVAMVQCMEASFGDYLQVLRDHSRLNMPAKAYTDEELERLDKVVSYNLKKARDDKQIKAKLTGTSLEFTGTDSAGNEIHSSSFLGKVTVLDFWASWCGPCLAEVPALKELEAKYGDQVNFVGITLRDKQDNWKKAIVKHDLHNCIYIGKEPENQFDSLSITGIPRFVVLDEEMKIIDPNAPRPSSGNLEAYFKR